MTSRFQPEPVTAEEVRAYRDLSGVGLLEAKRLFEDRNFNRCLADLRANGTVEEKVDFLLSQLERKST